MKEKNPINNMPDIPCLYSLPRSGGTLIYNIVNYLFSGYVDPLSHSYELTDSKVVVTYRDFRDCAISWWRVKKGGFDEVDKMEKASFNDVKKYLDLTKRSINNHLNEYKKKYPSHQIFYMQYEKFYNNFEYIFEKFENFLELKISEEDRIIVKEEFSLESNKKRARKFENFSMWSKKYRIHGHHIFTGEVGTWKKIINLNDHNAITEYLYNELKEWGYE